MNWLANMTWPEVEAAIAAGYTNLLLMLGATEQHGPHLPLATDTLVAEELAGRVAARLGKTLIAPVIPVGTSDEHMAFAGTLSLSKSTLAAIIAETGRSASQHGFKRLVVLTAHGGNYDAIRMGVEQLRREQPGLEVVAFTDLLEELRSRTKNSTDWHAGEHETSEMLWLRPDLVQMAKAEAGYTGDFKAIFPRLTEVGLRPVTPNGVLGDPAPAKAERGERYLEETAQALAEAIKSRAGDW